MTNIRRRPPLAFFVRTYATSWAYWIPPALAGVGVNRWFWSRYLRWGAGAIADF